MNIVGGDHDIEIEYVALSLVTRAEAEVGDFEFAGAAEFARHEVSGGFGLAAEQHYSIPFEIPVPWETPVTTVNGQPLRGMAVGVRTELAVAKAADKGDLDEVRVHPLAGQEAVLDAFQQLGLSVKHADVETGRIAGVAQQLGFYQEIVYYPSAQFAGRIGEI